MSYAPKRNESIEPHDDRWHFLDFPDAKHHENYIEWKYFNFIQKDLAGYVMYYILDPEKKTKMGGGRLLVRILKNGMPYGSIKKIDMDKIDIDPVSAGVKMGGAKILEHDSYHYELDCSFEDVAWNLNYKQETPSIESFQNVHTGLMLWEKINWLIKMPRAEVKGDIRIGKKNFHINGLGYSDTNWGEMLPFFSKYEWGQYNEKSFSLVFGILYDIKQEIKSAYVYFILKEHIVELENAKCEIEHLEWEEDKIIGVKIPSKNIFTIKNNDYEIKFSTMLVDHDSPGLKIAPFLPASVVSEQIVEYEGTVKKGDKILYKFKGRGFEEWSGKTWKEPLVSFN